MRDQTIQEAFNRFESAVGHDINNLTKQNVLNRSRIFAFEKVVFGSRGSFLRVILLNLLAPAKLTRMINAAHALEVQEFNADMEKRKGEAGAKKLKII